MQNIRSRRLDVRAINGITIYPSAKENNYLVVNQVEGPGKGRHIFISSSDKLRV